MFSIKNLWSQFTMQYLNPIYAIFHLSGLKTLIQPKEFICYRKDPWGCFFRVEIPTQGLYLKTTKFLSPLTRLLLKSGFLLANLYRDYCNLSLTARSNFLLCPTLTILDGQILVILIYLLTKLKLMVDIQWM